MSTTTASRVLARPLPARGAAWTGRRALQGALLALACCATLALSFRVQIGSGRWTEAPLPGADAGG